MSMKLPYKYMHIGPGLVKVESAVPLDSLPGFVPFEFFRRPLGTLEGRWCDTSMGLRILIVLGTPFMLPLFLVGLVFNVPSFLWSSLSQTLKTLRGRSSTNG